MSHNLLTDPLFTVDTPDGTRDALTLPAVLARVAVGEALEFAAAQAHQIQSWESFLIQLGALAAHANGGSLPEGEDAWRAALRGLTAGDDRAWNLVEEDVTKPAFMQPPIAGSDFRDPRAAMWASDELDMLVTSKNHDVKTARAGHARPEHWVFVLVNLQTSDGYPGKLNYGISRMNGGLGSRPSVGLSSDLRLGARFRRDVSIWLTQRPVIIEQIGLCAADGHALLWTIPWDGDQALALDELDPFFIEVCRRLRLGQVRDAIVGWSAPSNVARVDAKERKGELGDIWVPIKRGDERAAYTASGSGFSYKVLSELLTGEKIDHAAAMTPQPGDAPDMLLIARVLVRGQGKTEGLHERVLPIPLSARRRVFGPPPERASVAKLARERVDDVTMVQNKVLHVALCALLQAVVEGQKLDRNDERTQRWKDDFDARVDQVFFERLWADLGATDAEDARSRWQRALVDLAWAVFLDATDAVPLPSVRRYRARAIAERVFMGSAHKHFAQAMKLSDRTTTQEVSP